MKSKQVYIVMGNSGCYDDFQAWPVKVFTTNKAAEDYAKKAKVEADRLIALSEKRVAKHLVAWDAWDGEGEAPKGPLSITECTRRNKFDPYMISDDCGVFYEVKAVPFEE